MLEVRSGAGGDRHTRQHALPSLQRFDQLVAEEERGAVIALVVWVVVALLLGGCHAVGKRWIERGLRPARAAHEAAATHEHDRVAVDLLADLAPAPPVPAGHIGEL
jgi:hypothetical protein